MLSNTECLCQLGAYDLDGHSHRRAVVERLEASNSVVKHGLQSQSTYGHVNPPHICQAYPLDGVVKAQVRMVLDLIDILWVKDNHGMRRPDDLKNASSLG